MSKKKRATYSLNDYIAGITFEDFETAQKKAFEESQGFSEASEYNLLNVLAKELSAEDRAKLNGESYKYYKTLDGLVNEAKDGSEEAIVKILAYAIRSYAPNNVIKKLNIWTSVCDADDICQIIICAALEAINNYKCNPNEFKNFSGFLKAHILGELKAAQKDSAPIKKNKQDDSITYVSLNGYFEKDDNGIDVSDENDDYEDFEKSEIKQVLIDKIKQIPDGELLLIYYKLVDCSKYTKKNITLQSLAEAQGITVKALRCKLEKAKQIFKKQNPNFYDDFVKTV